MCVQLNIMEEKIQTFNLKTKSSAYNVSSNHEDNSDPLMSTNGAHMKNINLKYWVRISVFLFLFCIGIIISTKLIVIKHFVFSGGFGIGKWYMELALLQRINQFFHAVGMANCIQHESNTSHSKCWWPNYLSHLPYNQNKVYNIF